MEADGTLHITMSMGIYILGTPEEGEKEDYNKKKERERKKGKEEREEKFSLFAAETQRSFYTYLPFITHYKLTNQSARLASSLSPTSLQVR